MAAFFLILLVILLLSFFLAWRSLSELEVPKEAKKALSSIKPKKELSGVFLFFQKKILHYQGDSSTTSSSSSL